MRGGARAAAEERDIPGGAPPAPRAGRQRAKTSLETSVAASFAHVEELVAGQLEARTEPRRLPREGEGDARRADAGGYHDDPSHAAHAAPHAAPHVDPDLDRGDPANGGALDPGPVLHAVHEMFEPDARLKGIELRHVPTTARAAGCGWRCTTRAPASMASVSNGRSSVPSACRTIATARADAAPRARPHRRHGPRAGDAAPRADPWPARGGVCGGVSSGAEPGIPSATSSRDRPGAFPCG